MNKVIKKIKYSKVGTYLLYNNKIINILKEKLIYRQRKAVNVAQFSEEILDLLKGNKSNIFPMFGTLLSIYRDKKFTYADDFDFGIIGEIKLSLIEELESLGLRLTGVSFVEKSRVVEVSFQYKGVKIDIFSLIRESSETISHYCPNFRQYVPYVTPFSQKVLKYAYPSFFIVKYPSFDFEFDPYSGFMIPNKAELIFENHYGSDWNVPKTSNFIDYSNYQFVEQESYILIGDSIELKGYFNGSI